MRARHMRASGGKLEEPVKKGTDVKDSTPSDTYAGGSSNVIKEAKKAKKGGRMCRRSGGKVEGEMAEKRLDRKPRAKGGRMGAEMRPFSAAATMKNRPGGDMDSVAD